MIIDDLDVVRVALPELEHKTPGPIYRHRPLAPATSLEFVQAYRRERWNLVQRMHRIQELQAGPRPFHFPPGKPTLSPFRKSPRSGPLPALYPTPTMPTLPSHIQY